MNVFEKMLRILIILTVIYLTAINCSSLNAEDHKSSVKKQLEPSSSTLQTTTKKPPEIKRITTPEVQQQQQPQHPVVGDQKVYEESTQIPESLRVGFYAFMGISLLAIFFFTYRSYRLRLSRAERRYGVQGDRSTQELTPLPVAIEEDSDNEDHTVFDINNSKRTRVS